MLLRLYHGHPWGHGQSQWLWVKQVIVSKMTQQLLTILLKLLHGLLSQMLHFPAAPTVLSSVVGVGRVAGRAHPRVVLVSELPPFIFLGERLYSLILSALLRWRPDSTKYICGCLCGHFEIWKALC